MFKEKPKSSPIIDDSSSYKEVYTLMQNWLSENYSGLSLDKNDFRSVGADFLSKDEIDPLILNITGITNSRIKENGWKNFLVVFDDSGKPYIAPLKHNYEEYNFDLTLNIEVDTNLSPRQTVFKLSPKLTHQETGEWISSDALNIIASRLFSQQFSTDQLLVIDRQTIRPEVPASIYITGAGRHSWWESYPEFAENVIAEIDNIVADLDEMIVNGRFLPGHLGLVHQPSWVGFYDDSYSYGETPLSDPGLDLGSADKVTAYKDELLEIRNSIQSSGEKEVYCAFCGKNQKVDVLDNCAECNVRLIQSSLLLN